MHHTFPCARKSLICAGLVAALGAGANAQETPPQSSTPDSLESSTEPNAWKFTFVGYLWIPAMDGTITIRGRSADVSTSVSDTFDTTFDNFKMGLSGRVEARHDKLTVFGDMMYVALEDERVKHPALGEGEFEFDEGFFELGLAYAVIDKPIGGDESRRFRLEPLAGARIYYLDLELSFDDAAIKASGDELWVDGFGGLRASVDVAERLNLFGRFDIGAGGSDFAWNAVLGADLKLGKHKRISLLGGYRWLDVDYENGSGDSKFQFDVLMHGPFLGLGFTF